MEFRSVMKSKKTKTKYTTTYTKIENGLETVIVKKYKNGPYIEFENKDNSTLRVSMFYGVLSSVIFYFLIFLILLLNIVILSALIIQPIEADILDLWFILIDIVGLNTCVYITALFIVCKKELQSRVYLFDKTTDTFTISRIKSESKLKTIFKANLSEIGRLDVKAIGIRDIKPTLYPGIEHYSIHLRFINGIKKIFFSIFTFAVDFTQFYDYTKLVCDFLNIQYKSVNKNAKKYFGEFSGKNKVRNLSKTLKEEGGIADLRTYMKEMGYASKKELIKDIRNVSNKFKFFLKILEIIPASCASCGHIFVNKKNKINIPSICPRCHQQQIKWPSLRLHEDSSSKRTKKREKYGEKTGSVKLARYLIEHGQISDLRSYMKEMEYSNKRKLINDILKASSTLQALKKVVEIIPASCISCGYIFDQKRIQIPSKCPNCLQKNIKWPSLQLK
ncbi:MAG: hypothetical protein ACFFAS_09745 [Promethearchaeota archaeon]